MPTHCLHGIPTHVIDGHLATCNQHLSPPPNAESTLALSIHSHYTSFGSSSYPPVLRRLELSTWNPLGLSSAREGLGYVPLFCPSVLLELIARSLSSTRPPSSIVHHPHLWTCLVSSQLTSHLISSSLSSATLAKSLAWWLECFVWPVTNSSTCWKVLVWPVTTSTTLSDFSLNQSPASSRPKLSTIQPSAISPSFFRSTAFARWKRTI